MKYSLLLALVASASALKLKRDILHPIHTTWDEDKPHPGYEANHDDFEGLEGLGAYDRQIPDNF